MKPNVEYLPLAFSNEFLVINLTKQKKKEMGRGKEEVPVKRCFGCPVQSWNHRSEVILELLNQSIILALVNQAAILSSVMQSAELIILLFNEN